MFKFLKNKIGKFFKLIFNIWFLYLIFFSFLAYLFLNPSGCSYPIKYSLGNLDPRFEISQEDTFNILANAEKIWEDSMGIDIFEYDPKGKLKINFVFDERQQLNIDIKKAEKKIEQSESSVKKVTTLHDDLLVLYNQKLSAYDISLKDYKQQMDTYNQKVDYWNNKGGAPSVIYDELNSQRSNLGIVYDQLSYQEQVLNELLGKVNASVDVTNLTIDRYNTHVDSFNQEFGGAREFDQGDYLSNTINIYEYRTMSDLTLVIAHEMGHALGLNHVDDPYSLMYYLMEKQDLNNIKLSKDDIQALKQRCRIK